MLMTRKNIFVRSKCTFELSIKNRTKTKFVTTDAKHTLLKRLFPILENIVNTFAGPLNVYKTNNYSDIKRLLINKTSVSFDCT